MISQRIQKYIDYKKISLYAFENSIESSRGSISKMIKEERGIGSTVIEKILTNYSDLNPEWLLTGRGEMLKNETSGTSPEKPSLEGLQCKIKLLKQTITDKDHIIALLTARIKELENKQNPCS